MGHALQDGTFPEEQFLRGYGSKQKARQEDSITTVSRMVQGR